MERGSRPARPRERGAAAVELAIVLPLLLVMVAGIVDFGRAYFTQVTITNAAREGARTAVMRLPGSEVEARTRAAIPSAIPVTVVAGTCPPTGGTTVTVTVRNDFTWIILEPMMNLFGGSSLPPQLESSATMRCGG